ncbi:MAG: phospho-N-acetylmuramoyl-pentapeptide-transferase [Clostridia bacterium]|nr:phospho-N-acetylmuramoyl-pentapeptide-transferase [Clostridia bacterium]
MNEAIRLFTGNFNNTYLIPFFVSLAVTVLMGFILIPRLRILKFGQQILEDGPAWHKSKAGTPTMGGIMFITGVLISSVIALLVDFDIKYLSMLVVALGFGVIGFVDDYVKVVKHRNLGLTASQKFILQAVLAIVYVLILKYSGDLSSEIIIPFTSKTLSMPWWLYVVFILFVVTGTVNAVNLTDGLDGLATSITIAVSLFFAVAGIIFAESAAGYFSAAVLGGCIGFLFFNHYPAKVFMGDTGSLFLGGAISVIAVGLRMPLILVIAGFVYLFETLSVIIQVTYFKKTGKRVFKMTPIHHHFEKCGWREKKIVAVFTAVTAVLCVIAFVSLLGIM